jgi:hypothetical protein
MDNPRFATLRISLESGLAYALLYTVDHRVGAAIPYRILGQERLRTLLTQLALNVAEIDVMLTRVAAGITYVLDLNHIDRETAERLLRRFAYTLS